MGGSAFAEPPPRALTSPTSIMSPVQPDAKLIPVDALFNAPRSYSAVWGDHGSIIYNSDQGGRLNLWRLTADSGPATLMQPSEERELFPRATADGQWVVYQSDRGGGEIYDLFIAPSTGGATRNLTATDDVNETFPVVSPDSRLVAYSSRSKTAAMTDLGLLDIRTGAKHLLTHEADGVMTWTPIAFSSDGRMLIANRTNLGQTHGAVYRVDVASGATTRLTADETQAYDVAGDLSPDGQWISVTVENAKGDRQAAVMDVARGGVILIKPDRWEQKAGRFSPDGKTLLFVSNVDGRDRVFTFNLETRATSSLPLPDGVNTDYNYLPAYSPDGTKILFPHSAGDSPLDYWVYDLASRTSKRATHMASLDPARLPKTQIVHYASRDGTVISAILWIPYNLNRDGKAPGIIYPHGGPTGQTKDSFDQIPAALASRGYMVLAPNPRGSTGYGRAFLEANRNDLGGGDLEDEVAGLEFLVATGYVDRAHVGITGGSYGGFMTMMAISKTPSLWAAAVDEYGIVDWASMYRRAAPPLREYVVSLIGDPTHNADVYKKTSPLTFLHQEKAPLLVLQGENDIRVPKEESEQIVEFLRKRGQVVDVHYYPEEGHGFSKREDLIDALTRTIDWFDRFLQSSASKNPAQ